MSLYSNIVILGTSVLFAGDLLPMQGRTASLLAQPQASELNRSKASGTGTPGPSVAISDPPFLRHPIQFGPNSPEITLAGRNLLKRVVTWLRQHREARILIVGSCDSGGSETCTRGLAEARGVAVRKFLGDSGVDPDQILGVKAWDNLDRSCRTSDVKCQQFNRSARIFMASSAAP